MLNNDFWNTTPLEKDEWQFPGPQQGAMINAAWTVMEAGFQSLSRTEVCVQQHRLVQPCIVKLRIRNSGSTKPRIAQGRKAQICISEGGFSKFRTSQIRGNPDSVITPRLSQIRIPNLAVTQVGTSQSRPFHIGPAEVHPRELRATKIRLHEDRTAKVCPSKVCAIQI
jgi:hypothetical protein